MVDAGISAFLSGCSTSSLAIGGSQTVHEFRIASTPVLALPKQWPRARTETCVAPMIGCRVAGVSR
jgi:hypothetical protein